MKKAKQILKEMFAGLVVWLLPVLIILVIVARHKLAMTMGVLLGGATAAGLLLHMYHHLDIALDMDVKHAQSHIQFAAIRRLFLYGTCNCSVYGMAYVFPSCRYCLWIIWHEDFRLFATRSS